VAASDDIIPKKYIKIEANFAGNNNTCKNNNILLQSLSQAIS
jgi:hypothetical protein